MSSSFIPGKLQTITHRGKPYFIKGVGGFSNLKLLAECGGNSFRIWDGDNCKSLLDEAEKLGLTVLVGLRMVPERHGFNYTDTKAVNAQHNLLIKQVKDIAGHPAIIGWCVGNEMDLEYTNADVWDAVERLLISIKKVDPETFVTTAITGNITSILIATIMKRCRTLDTLSVNIYGTIGDLKDKLIKAGWTGSYLITEWGVDGYWEVEKTDWGAPIEPTSSQKAEMYLDRYRTSIDGNSNCIGSYAFLWGQKQERTHTWFGLLTDNGTPIESIKALKVAWNSSRGLEKVGTKIRLMVNGQDIESNLFLKPGESGIADVIYSGSANLVEWELAPESTETSSGGDKEKRPAPIKGNFIEMKDNKLKFKIPDQEGAYRLFVKVMSEDGYAATANYPFFVK